MSKFNIGDKVRVVSITDIDADYDDPKRVMRTTEAVAEWLGWPLETVAPAISDTGVVTEIYNDYYDVSIKLDRDNGNNDEYSMIDADLELVT